MIKVSKEQYENDMELIFRALSKIMDKLKIKPDKDLIKIENSEETGA